MILQMARERIWKLFPRIEKTLCLPADQQDKPWHRGAIYDCRARQVA